MRMQKMAFGLLALVVLFCAGCDDFPDSVRERIDGVSRPHVRVFSAEQRATYLAARAAIDQMGFRYVRGGPAEGELEALSGLSPGDTGGGARQFSLKAKFSPRVGEGTEVSVWLKEVVEGDSEHRQGFATENPVRDTPLYETFFRGIQQGLEK